jgi:hypothetical protein
VGKAAHLNEKKNVCAILAGNLKKRESLEDLCIDGSKMLKCFCSVWVGVDSIILAQSSGS